MVAKKTTAKKTIKKKAVKARSSKPAVQKTRSFRISEPEQPFMTFAPNRQTVYWCIIALAMLSLGAWILHLQNQVNELYDSIDANSSMNMPVPIEKTTE